MAFAAPEVGQSGENRGPQADDHGGRAGAPPSGTTSEDGSAGEPNTGPTSRAGTTAGPSKPTSQVGDGRSGLDSRRHRPGAGDSPGGKRSDPDPISPPLNHPATPGEPVKTGPPGVGEGGHGWDGTYPRGPKVGGWPGEGPCPPGDDPDQPPGSPPGGGTGGGGGGGGGAVAVPPRGLPQTPPVMQLPPPRELPPVVPGVVDPVADVMAGLASAASALPFVPITLPVVVAPVGAGAGGTGGPGIGPRPGTPSAPRASGAPGNDQPPQRASRQNPPAYGASNGVTPESFRVGYGNYLRNAGIGQVAAVAVPGVTGILIITGAGGLLGYRQARAGRAVRATGTARFVG
jgi:hypothetical protein